MVPIADLISEIEKQINLLSELLQVEKECDEAEAEWKQMVKEKEHMYALLAEEIITYEIRKANSKAELIKLRQKVEIDTQVLRDDFRRLEDELSRLLIARQTPDVSPQSGDSSCDKAEATSSEPSAVVESSKRRVAHWICMMCLENEVCMVYLPCKHHVVCFPCHERNLNIVGAKCPACHVGIEESLKVFGRGS
ncbi:hypothetical protein ABFS83_10G123100 [Erythranthe nasuta]